MTRGDWRKPGGLPETRGNLLETGGDCQSLSETVGDCQRLRRLPKTGGD